jgi:long-chain acyl-CoA synthetase
MATISALLAGAELRLRDRTPYYVPTASGFSPRTGADLARARRALSAALAARGIGKGDRVAVVSDTRFEWVIADLAILALGAITVGVYPTSTPAQMKHILTHARCRAILVGGAGPRAAIASLMHELQDIACVVDLDDAPARGALALSALLSEHANDTPPHVDVSPDDVATIVYTSGTTGTPKGAVLTHGALFSASRTGIDALGITEADTGVAFLPLSHVLARVNLYGTLHAGNAIWFSQSLETVADVWRAARPTVISVVPRVLEKVHARIHAAVAASPATRRKLFARTIEIGQQRARLLEQGAPVPRTLSAEHALWDRLVGKRVRAGLGWDRLRFIICGGAPLRREVSELCWALGVPVLEGYGLSETSAASIVNTLGAARIGTVGKPLPNVQLRLARDGEILLRGPGLFTRYEGDDDATREAFDAEGFFKTGDVGALDDAGFLRITDRKKDLLVTAGGKNVAPQAIEAALLGDPRIAQAIVLGDNRPYLVALLVVDPTIGLDRARVAQEAVARANASLARFEQVKRWHVLDDELTVDSGLLTPTQKVKRRAVLERYAREVEALYESAQGDHPRQSGDRARA